MIASILTLDRQAVKQLHIRDSYSIHKLIYGLFPVEKRTFLYYDQGGDMRGKSILLLSKEQPLIPEFGEIQSKKIPSDFLQLDRYAFQVLLNPVIRKDGMKKRIPVIGREELYHWFLRRQNDWGFSADPEKLEIADIGVQEILTDSRHVTINKSLFIGVLYVSNRDLFRNSFEQGIGKAKGFGFGLLQLRPLS